MHCTSVLLNKAHIDAMTLNDENTHIFAHTKTHQYVMCGGV